MLLKILQATPVALLLAAPVLCAAQDTTAMKRELDEVVITGFQANAARRTSLNIEPYSLLRLNERGPYNLTDALSKLPGIAQMSTGNAIAKPVIRGLYGNRILVLFSGLRFDNQQWQDEHGLGLSQIGISKVEVIKGPASVLYGSDAIGGVINIVEDKPDGGVRMADAGTQIFSNTRGTLTDAGYALHKGSKWWRIRLGAESHADYSDGNGKRVLNSRNNGYYLKAGYGAEHKNWTQENSYNFSINQFGFIMEDLATFFTPDARGARAMNGPHHIVILNLLNSQNNFRLHNSTLKLNVGGQSNVRMEDEGGGQISLNMHLLSALQNLRWEKSVNKHTTLVVNQQFTWQQNTNYGGRILIPDATMMEGNASGYLRYATARVVAELGCGINDKYIHTIATRSLNMPGDDIQPFSRNRVTANGMAGVAYSPATQLTLKANSSSGFRAPNLAELSANGLHEGVYRYETGDPGLKLERNINTDVTIEKAGRQLFLSASVFYNKFFDYVYLYNTNTKRYGFPVFNYRQQDASLTGGEAFLTLQPEAWKGVLWKETFSLTNGKLADGTYLPFIPAYRLSSALRWQRRINNKIPDLFAEPEVVYVFTQDRPGQFETPTPAYYLLNFTAGVVVSTSGGDWRIGINLKNITNTAYFDHLSRLKYYNVYNEGFNFVIYARKQIKWHQPSAKQ